VALLAYLARAASAKSAKWLRLLMRWPYSNVSRSVIAFSPLLPGIAV
jgi:hypothetical protein